MVAASWYGAARQTRRMDRDRRSSALCETLDEAQLLQPIVGLVPSDRMTHVQPPKPRPESEQRDVLLPLPCAANSILWATEYRSTWIVSSLASLRSSHHFDAYLQALRGLDRSIATVAEQRLLNCVAGEWLPMSIARAHYDACNALSLSESELLRMAVEGDGGQVRRAWHAQFIGAAERPDATPWNILPQLQKLWLRTANGGAAAVYRRGQNRATVEYVGCELFDVRHFRLAVRAVLFVLTEHFCEDFQISTEPQQHPGSACFQLRWRDGS